MTPLRDADRAVALPRPLALVDEHDVEVRGEVQLARAQLPMPDHRERQVRLGRPHGLADDPVGDVCQDGADLASARSSRDA